MVSDPELGFGFRSIGRGLKKVGKGAYKYSGAGLAVQSSVAAAKLAAKLALLPLILLKKAVTALGRAFCKAPPQLLALAATQANVDPAFMPIFCQAVRVGHWSLSSVRRMLPPALKVAVKLAATGVFPPIVPALAIIKHIPGVGRFAGADDMGSSAADLRQPTIRAAIANMETVALADYLGLLEDQDAAAMGLSSEDRGTMQGYLQGAALGASDHANLGLGLAAATSALGIYLIVRK